MSYEDTIPFLIKQEVAFVCEKCGDVTQMRVPGRNGRNVRSYCCSAQYECVTDRDGEIMVRRIEDEESNKDIKEAEAVGQRLADSMVAAFEKRVVGNKEVEI